MAAAYHAFYNDNKEVFFFFNDVDIVSRYA